MNQSTREQVDVTPGAQVLEFGASWCGYCLGSRDMIDREIARHPSVRHTWIEDGPGRSFAVKLWPTLVFLRDGREVALLVRPTRDADVRDALAQISVAERPVTIRQQSSQ